MNAETEILNQRAEIVRAIDGQTICGLLQLAAEQAADQPALSDVAAPPGAPARADSGAAAAAAAQAGPDTTLTWSQAGTGCCGWRPGSTRWGWRPASGWP